MIDDDETARTKAKKSVHLGAPADAVEAAGKYYLQGGSDDASARTIALNAWQNRPADATVTTASSTTMLRVAQATIATLDLYTELTADKKGTNILGLIEAANKMGFDARGVRGPLESLLKIPKPAIAHVIINKTLHHYVVIYHATKNYIEVMDPGDGALHRHTHEEFLKIWSGVLVLIWPGQHFESGEKKTSIEARLWALIRTHKSMMIQALFGAIVYTLIGLSSSIYLQKIIDYVLIDGNRNLLNLMSVGMIVLLILLMISPTRMVSKKD